MIQHIISGLQAGSWYSLLAVAIVIVMKATDVPNFATADMGLFGAFACYGFMRWRLPFGVAVVLALLAAALFGVVVDRVIMQRLAGKSHFPLLLMTIGLALAIDDSLALFWGTQGLALNTPWSNKTVHFAGQVASWDEIITIVLGIVVTALVGSFFRTPAGIRMRAVAENRSAARLLGVRIKRVSAVAWGMGTAVAAIAMILETATTELSYTSAATLTVSAFVAATAAGFSSPSGAFVAGLVIGVLENLAGGYISTTAQTAIALIVIVVLLLIRPAGFSRTSVRLREV